MRPLLHQKLQNGTGEVRDRGDVLMFEFAQEHGDGIAVQQIEEFTPAGEAIMKNVPGSVGTGANAPGVDGGHPFFQLNLKRRPNQTGPPLDGRGHATSIQPPIRPTPPTWRRKGPNTRTGLYKRKLATSGPIQSHNSGRYYVSENNSASFSSKAN